MIRASMRATNRRLPNTPAPTPITALVTTGKSTGSKVGPVQGKGEIFQITCRSSALFID